MFAQQVVFFDKFSQPCCSAATSVSPVLSFTFYVLATAVMRRSQILGTMVFILKSDSYMQSGNTTRTGQERETKFLLTSKKDMPNHQRVKSLSTSGKTGF